MRKIAFLTVLMGGLTSAFAAGTVQLRMEVSPREIHIGDVVTGRIIVTHDSDVTPVVSSAPASLGAFEIRSWASGPSQPSNQKLAQTTEFQITTFSTGTQVLSALTLQFKNADGSMSEAKTDEVQIQVKSLLQEKGDEGRLRPLKGLYNVRSWLWLWILLGVAALAAAGVWLSRVLQKRKGVKDIPIDPRTPDEIAWEALQELEDENLLADGRIKDFYSRLSDILRIYLEGRYQITALEKTTSELLADIRPLGLFNEVTALLRQFLETGDLVKFAKFAPEQQEIEADLLRVKEFLTKTTPVKAEPEPEAKTEDKVVI